MNMCLLDIEFVGLKATADNVVRDNPKEIKKDYKNIYLLNNSLPIKT